MAVIRLIILLSMIITAVTAVGDGEYHIKCYGGGGDAGTAVQLKQTLVRDLMDKVPVREDGQHYCNVQAWNGLQMYGYAYCMMKGRDDAVSACQGCLSVAGNILMGGCQGTGLGQVIGEHDLCYVWVGFSGCPSQYNFSL